MQADCRNVAFLSAKERRLRFCITEYKPLAVSQR